MSGGFREIDMWLVVVCYRNNSQKLERIYKSEARARRWALYYVKMYRETWIQEITYLIEV